MPLHKARKWQLCLKLAFHNLGDSSFTAGDNRLTARFCSSGPAKKDYQFMVPMVEHTAQVSVVHVELLDCWKGLSW